MHREKKSKSVSIVSLWEVLNINFFASRKEIVCDQSNKQKFFLRYTHLKVLISRRMEVTRVHRKVCFHHTKRLQSDSSRIIKKAPTSDNFPNKYHKFVIKYGILRKNIKNVRRRTHFLVNIDKFERIHKLQNQSNFTGIKTYDNIDCLALKI